MNKLVNLTNLGGFPFTQKTLEFMQQSYHDALGSLALLAGDKVILTGVAVVGSNVSGGWITYNGEIIPFVGGGLAADVVISTATEQATYEDQTVRDAYVTKTAACGAPGTFPFSDLKRLTTITAAQQSLTDLIEAFANHAHAWSDITNKPAGYITYTGGQQIGDVGTSGPPDNIFTITIPNQGGTNYIVAGSMVGQNSNFRTDDNVLWIVTQKAATSFNVAIREVSTGIQNLRFEYAIIKTL